MTPEQMKYVKLIEPASTWNLLQNDQEQAVHYVTSVVSLKLTKIHKNLNTFGFLLQKSLKTPTNTRPIRNNSYGNYKPYRNWGHLILQKLRNQRQSSKKTVQRMKLCKSKNWLLNSMTYLRDTYSISE